VYSARTLSAGSVPGPISAAPPLNTPLPEDEDDEHEEDEDEEDEDEEDDEADEDEDGRGDEDEDEEEDEEDDDAAGAGAGGGGAVGLGTRGFVLLAGGTGGRGLLAQIGTVNRNSGNTTMVFNRIISPIR